MDELINYCKIFTKCIGKVTEFVLWNYNLLKNFILLFIYL